MSPRSCPACEDARAFAFVEERRDPVGGVLYRLHRCSSCGLVFPEPRDPVGPGWYEKAAPLRAKERRHAPERDRRFRQFLDAELAPGKILDLGCGDGGFLLLCAARGWKGVGVDYETRMIELATARGLDAHARDYAEFLKGRASKEFDAVALFDVLEHVPEPRELLARIKPVLKRGGHLVVTFPNDRRPGLFGREEFDYPPHHFTRWSAPTLRGFLEREGFVIVDQTTFGPTVWWFSEEMFFAWLAPAAVKAARRVLFGAASKGTLSDLYTGGEAQAPGPPPGGLKGLLADKSRRQGLVDLVKYACRVVTYPAGAALALWYRVLRRDSGEHLYCLARYEG